MRYGATPVLAGLSLVVLAGCGGHSNDGSRLSRASLERAPASMAIVAAPPPGAATDVIAQAASAAITPVAPRVRIRNAALDLVVTRVDSAAAAVERIAAVTGGYVEFADRRPVDGEPFRRLTLRVPAPRLDSILTLLRALAVHVDEETIETHDVTDQAVDLDARLRTLRATEQELLGVLHETRARGGKAEDVMAVYRELTGIRIQIEQLDGQQRSLAGQIAMSSVVLTLTSDSAARPLAGSTWRPDRTIRDSLRMLVTALRGLGDVAIFTVVVMLPIGTILAIVLWILARVFGPWIARLRSSRPR